jgi:3-phytase
LIVCIAGFILIPAIVGASPGLVAPVAETQAPGSGGYAVNAPVVWVNSSAPTQTMIIGTDAKGGLLVYNLAGQLIHRVPDTKIYNIDLRYNFPLADHHTDLVVGSNPSENVVVLWAFDAKTLQFKPINNKAIKVGIKIYKSCLYHSSKQDKFYLFAFAKNGEVEQWELFDSGHGEVEGLLLRAFDVGSQVESCVADDRSAFVYFAEKRLGVWRYRAEPQEEIAPILVDKTDGSGHLKAGVEAVALYDGGHSDEGYLVVASQGGAEYVVYRNNRNNDYVTTFRIVAGNGVDTVNETEGLAIASNALGRAFPQGMLVLHDEGNDSADKQNFKLISWESIAKFIGPPPTSDAKPAVTKPADGNVKAAGSGGRGTIPAPTGTVYLPHVEAKTARQSRGYLTTPQELGIIKQKATADIEPYKSAVANVLAWADRPWDFLLQANESCQDADNPAWLDDSGGIPILYAKALAYHLTGEQRYAEEVQNILQRIMTEVRTITVNDPQCQLNFGWGTPELVASADLIDTYWQDHTCSGPISTLYTDTTVDTGDCKTLFQNWLAKNPYYVVSYAAATRQNNWGVAATTATAYIADYLWDRSTVKLIQRNPRQVNAGVEQAFSPSAAYDHAVQIMFARMNGYGVEYSDNTCDSLKGGQQDPRWAPVKSQITESGIVPEDARREEACNIPHYNGKYQNYPQLYISLNIQQCELMLRRGDNSCYENIDNTDIPDYSYADPDGVIQTTHLYPGRGSLERAIKAIIVDAATEWKHESALEVAYRYYYGQHKQDGLEQWPQYFKRRPSEYDQDICFGTLTHGFAPNETPVLPPTVPAP